MAPWTRHMIETQLDKINVHNYNDVAKRTVGHLDSRTTVRQLSIMCVRSANRWYTPSFHERLDVEKRNLCDQFIASLVHAMALRTKPIRDVPTPEGLSGIPLLKADLLSVWIYRRMSIGPIATALFNSGNLTVDDLVVVLRACLDTTYLAKFSHLGDALLLLEHGGRQLDTAEPETFSALFDKVKELLDTHKEKASERRMIGERVIPSMYDRYNKLAEKRQQGWRSSPYGAESRVADSDSLQVAMDGPSDDADKDMALRPTSTLESSGTEDDADLSLPHTPQLSAGDELGQDDDGVDAVGRSSPLENGSFDDFWYGGALPASRLSEAGDHAESPWNAYFAPRAAKQRRTRDPFSATELYGDAAGDATLESPRGSRRPSEASPLSASVAKMSIKKASPTHVDAEIMPRRMPSTSTTRRHSTLVALPHTSASSYLVDRAGLPGHSEALARLLAPRGSLPESSLSTSRPAARQYPTSVIYGEAQQQAQTPSAPRRRTKSTQSAVAHTNKSRPQQLPSSAETSQTTPKSDVDRSYVVSTTDGRSSALKTYPATFEGDATWIELQQPLASPVRVRFPSNFLIGDAQRVAHIFARALKSDGDADATSHSAASTSATAQSSGQLLFTPSGGVMEEFLFGEKAIHVEYPSSMTLAEARDAGQRLAFVAAHLAV